MDIRLLSIASGPFLSDVSPILLLYGEYIHDRLDYKLVFPRTVLTGLLLYPDYIETPSKSSQSSSTRFTKVLRVVIANIEQRK